MASTESYCTTAEAKAVINKIEANHDVIIASAILAVSREFDHICGRERDGFVAPDAAVAREFVGSGLSWQRIHECAVTPTLVEVKPATTDEASDYESWDATDWLTATGDSRFPEFGEPPYTLLFVAPWGDETHFTDGRYGARRGWWRAAATLAPGSSRPPGFPTVRVTAQWGYATEVPSDIKRATIIEAARLYKNGLSDYADTLASADFGQLLFTKGLHPSTVTMLEKGRWMRPAMG